MLVIRIVFMSAVILLSGCPFKKKGGPSKKILDGPGYDILPSPPIPPENYCYELQGNDKSILRLTVMGDSVFGTLQSHIGQSNEEQGALIGTLYDSTILASYLPKGSKTEKDEEWKMRGDSIYQKITTIVPRDSAQKRMPDSISVSSLPALRKVACK